MDAVIGDKADGGVAIGVHIGGRIGGPASGYPSWSEKLREWQAVVLGRGLAG